ncbi:serine hydroxymethyltransferase [Kutzneria sp. 744]|uniref:serine hydroxymethyltransferase n=1 Tax=Kutzneria sp. (strain 744) TaxID=345341 RepID=UPI0003EEC46E|nr:serine hydroxymethyltransferase [Kutzneria sp. 744]EWM13726.1 glycine hydroxymethyltransferase [Kutzneria sp. 744]
MIDDPLHALVQGGLSKLALEDPDLWDAMLAEQRRQAGTLSLVASSSVVDPSVLASQASVAVNVTAEGYPGRRYHAGCEAVDDIERLAVDRARRLFGARYANVQPHSATTANYAVLSALMRPGDTMLGMALDSGGHLTHGSPAAYAGRYFHAVGYGLTETGLLDYDEVAELAARHRPRVIVCGATAYSRTIDFRRFREIADQTGAYLLADISHTAGLVVTGHHPNPIDHAHITTCCTHKQLYGPRGGLILSGEDADGAAPIGSGTLGDFLQRTVFPFYQGAPALNVIAAKARALAIAAGDDFRATMGRVVALSRVLADELASKGHTVVSGGTDNHIVLLDLTPLGITGVMAERALQECGIVVNKNRVPGDTKPALVTSGLRLGVNSVALRGMGATQARACARLLDDVLRAVRADGPRHHLPEAVRDATRAAVADLCARFPVPGYPVPASVLSKAG